VKRRKREKKIATFMSLPVEPKILKWKKLKEAKKVFLSLQQVRCMQKRTRFCFVLF
jgi:hypothetical protein